MTEPRRIETVGWDQPGIHMPGDHTPLQPHELPPSNAWMQIYSGEPFWPLESKPEHIDINDIAHALGMVCRYAGEAYIGDVVRPLKHQLPSYMEAEERLTDAIAIKFGLEGPMPDQVKEHDTRIVVDEREQIMAPSRLPWSALEGYTPLGVTIQGWDPYKANRMFLDRFYQLNENTENRHA
jgi:hypothetical protein